MRKSKRLIEIKKENWWQHTESRDKNQTNINWKVEKNLNQFEKIIIIMLNNCVDYTRFGW